MSMKPMEQRGKVAPALNASQNLLLPLVEERLGGAVAKLGLEVIAGRRPQVVFLENIYCRLVLIWYESDNVVCRFEGRGQANWEAAGHVFDLQFFLYLQLGAGVSKYLPNWWEGAPIHRRWLCLDGIHAALVNGEFAGPLSGDFSWAGDYHRLEAESYRLLDRLWAAILTRYRPEFAPLQAKWQKSDPSWIGDARDLLAQYGEAWGV